MRLQTQEFRLKTYDSPLTPYDSRLTPYIKEPPEAHVQLQGVNSIIRYTNGTYTDFETFAPLGDVTYR